MPCRRGARDKTTGAVSPGMPAETKKGIEPKAREAFSRGEPVQTGVRHLPRFYWAAIELPMEKSQESDPISYMNRNLVTSCPKCGVVYNEHGFEIGYLASLASSREAGTPIVFSSGGEGIYPRCLVGICPNGSCYSKIAVVEWKG